MNTLDIVSWDHSPPVYDHLICKEISTPGNTGSTVLVPYCMSCKQGTTTTQEQPKVTLKKCSRCKLIYYCSQACQKEDHAQHKKRCIYYAKCAQKVEQEVTRLNDTSMDGASDPFGPPERPFETAVGSFWGIFGTRDYMRAQMSLNRMQLYFASMTNLKELWQLGLDNSLELLRLCSSDNSGIRFCVPFLLMNLNRDDDAFAFCKYWIHDSEHERDETRAGMHRDSQKGDWMYERKDGMRFDSMDEWFPSPFHTRFTLALCLIKIRLISDVSVLRQNVDSFVDTTGLDDEGVSSIVGGFVLDEKSRNVNLEEERRTVHRLMDVIHGANPTVLPAILNPGPLLRQSPPSYYSPGDPTEAYSLVQDAMPSFRQNDLAMRLLEERFGPNPTYPH
eukprot:scaffold16341_cov53-Attheya_sp.AAC.4